PAANSIAAQVKRLYLGREGSGPIFVPPTLENATISTNTTTIVAVRTQYQPKLVATQAIEPKMTVSAVPGQIPAKSPQPRLGAAAPMNPGQFTGERRGERAAGDEGEAGPFSPPGLLPVRGGAAGRGEEVASAIAVLPSVRAVRAGSCGRAGPAVGSTPTSRDRVPGHRPVDLRTCRPQGPREGRGR